MPRAGGLGPGSLEGVGHAIVLAGLPHDRVVLAAVVVGHPNPEGHGGFAVPDGAPVVGVVGVGGDAELGVEPVEGLLGFKDWNVEYLKWTGLEQRCWLGQDGLRRRVVLCQDAGVEMPEYRGLIQRLSVNDTTDPVSYEVAVDIGPSPNNVTRLGVSFLSDSSPVSQVQRQATIADALITAFLSRQEVVVNAPAFGYITSVRFAL
jgi:hypothetical protein